MVSRSAIAAAPALTVLAVTMMSAAGHAQEAKPSAILETEPACAGMLPAIGYHRAGIEKVSDGKSGRQAGIDDLLALRDIGFSHLGDLSQAIKISPDGRLIAVVLSRGDPRTNSYCQLLVAVPTDGKGPVRPLDTVGQPDFSRATIRGLYIPSGVPAPNVPLWSPDGTRIAYVKRAGTRSEAWQVEVATGERRRISPAEIDVERIGWINAGHDLAVGYRTGRDEVEAGLREEAKSGYLFDERFATYTGNQPVRRANLPLVFKGIDLSSLAQRDLTEAERASVAGPRVVDAESLPLMTATNSRGRRAWTAREAPKTWPSPVRIWGTDESGKTVRCEDADCIGGEAEHFITSLWWSSDGQWIYWLRRTGWSNGDLGLYRWRPGSPAEKVLQTSDLILDCHDTPRGLFCLHESSTSPRKIVRIDTRSGQIQSVFDPNPEWSGLHLGKVERLHWRNDQGLEVFGDLVLPPEYRPGTRVPLIVTQYTSRGFLRGGTGDESPIFPFAARGYAVLSYNMPKFYYLGLPGGRWASYTEAERVNYAGWRQRQSALSALLGGVDLVVSKGIAAPGDIGITGLSDGGSTAQHAIVSQPDRFAAASVTDCCMEPNILMVYGGTALADERRDLGFPGVYGDDLLRWKPVSISLNAEAVKTPLLMSNADSEFSVGIETFMALRDAGKAAEMYVYPGEYHLKVQPVHREAAYKRNIAWFDFWLRHQEDTCMASPAEFDRWRKMPGAPRTDRPNDQSLACHDRSQASTSTSARSRK